MLSDLQQALRTLRRNPGFAAIVILILGAGIGANTAMFSIVDGVLLRPLPFRDPGRLVAVQEAVPRLAKVAPQIPVNAVHFEYWQRNWHAAEALSLVDTRDSSLTSGGEPERIPMGRVSWNLFAMLGIEAQLGRTFRGEEDHDGADREVVLSDALWHRRFHGDRSIVGQKILLNDVPYEVIGVLKAGAQIPKVSELQPMDFGNEVPEIWKPFALRDEERDDMGDFNYGCIARLKPGVSVEAALAELNAVQAGFAAHLSDKTELRAAIEPLQDEISGRSKQGLLLLLLAVGAVLLIVCVNVANLLLARASGRSREFAVRAAIGATASRLMRQMLTESLLVSILGGALGLAIASAALPFLLSKAPSDLPRLNEIHIDTRVLGLAFALSVVSSIVFGLIPAWKSSRTDPQKGLRGGGRSGTASKQSGRLRSALVGIEVALCTVCLAAAGLLLNSFVRVMHVDKGFEAEHVMSVDLLLPSARYPDFAHRTAFLRELIDAAHGVPGVSAVGVSNMLPLVGEGSNNIVNLEGDTTPPQERPIVDFRMVNEDFFRAMGIPLVAGRAIEARDRDRPVAVISQSMAQHLWPGQDPIGKRFHLGDAPLAEVIGVAGDVHGVTLQKRPNPTTYIPYWQRDRPFTTLIVRAVGDPASIVNAVRSEIHRLDREMPVQEFRTMGEIVSASVAARRFQLSLVLLFAGVALALASLGIYGVVSYSVAQRRGEMGIRMALGATSSDLRSLVLRQGLSPVMIGLICGLLGSLAAGRVLSGMLFGVSSADPLTMGVVAMALTIVAAVACYVPARRAMKSDPLVALRYE